MSPTGLFSSDCREIANGPSHYAEMVGVDGRLVVWWWLWLEGFVPPPVGAFAGRPGVGRDVGWGSAGGTGDRSCAEPPPGAVGDDEVLGRAGDGDQAAVMCPVVIRAEQHQVVDSVGPPSSQCRMWWACRPRVAPHPGTTQLRSRCSSTRRSRRLTVRVVRPTPIGRPSRSNHTRRWHHRSGSGGRPRRAADPDAGRRRVVRHRRGPPRWCAARAGGGWLQCPSRPRPGAGTPRGHRASAARSASPPVVVGPFPLGDQGLAVGGQRRLELSPPRHGAA